MSANTNITPAPAVHQASANAATPASQAAMSSAGQPTSLTTIGSMGDLKKKAPKIYNMMVEGLGMQITQEMQHHQDRLKQLMREGQNQQ